MRKTELIIVYGALLRSLWWFVCQQIRSAKYNGKILRNAQITQIDSRKIRGF